MAMTNHERVGKALELLKTGLAPFVEREIKDAIAANGLSIQKVRGFVDDPILANKAIAEWDASALIKMMWETWNEVFKKTLGFPERSLVSEIRDWRNKWAHQQTFSSDDTDRALDSVERLLTAVSALQADDVRRMKMELRRLVGDEQARGERRKSAGTAIESAALGNLKPWREVITPHKDVASGRYQQAEFAADLWQVHLGEGTDEYRNPAEFFRRTYLTESLKHLLLGAMRRISGTGGDPVVQLQTNFGGGKTHSMLALYHLFSGVSPTELLGIEAVMQEAAVAKLSTAKRVVLVGNKISPGNPATKPDGTVVRTLWGEMAWQLGGKKAFERIRADDENATSPGDALRELFNDYGPCLILIDEWVAYARQLHDQSDLPGGGFETQFSFAQALTESAKLARNCLLVISLPASDTATSPHLQADDEEVGGERGRAALSRLRNVVGRLESSWTPATAEEGFEIVRRRLFEPMIDTEHYKHRDVVARTFADLYHSQHQEFPPECRNADYEKRIRAAYPIHPEVFDRLYTDWSTLVKFQRTRGVLRLMAAVIHSLWEKGDRNPLILPAHIPIDDPRVRDELTRYLPDVWKPIIERDVDGPNALPLAIDGEVPNLGKFSACRRVARTIYLGSAPISSAANRGLEDRRVKLGCVMPGESPAVFGDALRRMAAVATYLYQDGPRYWYSTQPTVTKLADDRAEQLKRDSDKVAQEVDKRLRADLRQTGDFSRVHPLPATSADVMDEQDVCLVVLGIDYTYSKEAGNTAEAAAKAIFETRGNSPRLYRNTLVFLAPDKTRLQDLDEAVRKFLAWQSILDEKDTLDLSPHQVKQAETQVKAADSAVTARLPETYQWLLVPTQATPQSTIDWQAIRLTGQDALAIRASKKLKNDELLVTGYGATRLRMELDRVPLWRGDHVAVKQLLEDFARYLYLPRLKNSQVLIHCISDGLGLITWEHDAFAYAESFDEDAKRYRGLRSGLRMTLGESDVGLVVKPDVARRQLDDEVRGAGKENSDATDTGGSGGTTDEGDGQPRPPGTKPVQKRFHGSVTIDPNRMNRDVSAIAEEVVQHLTALVGAQVEITLEIQAIVPGGVPDNVVRVVLENGRSLHFKDQAFEEE